jgi:gas vesicle protein
MNYDRGFSFIGGFVLGGIVGAAAALLLAPASGEETRDQIRSEGVALKHRGQEFGHDRIQEAQKIVKQGQKDVSDAQARFGGAIQDQKEHLQEAVDAGKQAVSHRKNEMVNRFQEVQAPKIPANA